MATKPKKEPVKEEPVKEELVKITIYTSEENVEYYKEMAVKEDRALSRYIHKLLTDKRRRSKK